MSPQRLAGRPVLILRLLLLVLLPSTLLGSTVVAPDADEPSGAQDNVVATSFEKPKPAQDWPASVLSSASNGFSHLSSCATVKAATTSEPSLPRCTSWSSNGFQHPGIYHDCDSLHRLQSNIVAKKAPYAYALANATSRMPDMQPDATWAMQGPFATVIYAGKDGHNLPLQRDGKSAYSMALGWYATANPMWLSRALQIILGWGSTLNYMNEHIQGGEGLAYMTAAAEILRASSKYSGWSDANTTTWLRMTARVLGQPWTETDGPTRANLFMNQGFYGNGCAMNLAVFSDNRTLYDSMLRHATVGANPNPLIDYAIPIQISGADGFVGQIAEMGRDQFHPMGSMRGLSHMGLTSKIQRGVDMYTQNNTRMLAGWEYWAKYNLGNNVSWTAVDEYYPGLNATGRMRNFATYGLVPLETIGVGYHEYFRRGLVEEMPYYSAYMKWQGIGWDVFEWGDDASISYLGFL